MITAEINKLEDELNNTYRDEYQILSDNIWLEELRSDNKIGGLVYEN